MKKVVVAVLAVIMVIAFAACSGGGSGTSPKSTTPATDSSSSSTPSQTAPKEVTVEQQVIYDQDGVKITVNGLNTGGSLFSFGPSLQLLIENNSTQDITVQPRDSSVNGIMVDSTMSSDVAIGKKANDDLTFFSSYLERSGISTIKDIEFKLNISDSETYKTITQSDLITVRTSAPDSYVQKYDDSGDMLVDQNGIKIVAQKLNDKTSFWGADIYLYIENNSGQDVAIQATNCSVNGYMLTPYISATVLDGKKAYSKISFMDSALKKNGIDKITDLELSFKVFDPNTYKTIFTTDTVTAKF